MKRMSAVVVLVLLAACSKEGEPLTQSSPTPTTSVPPLVRSTARLTFVEPQHGATVSSSSIPVTLELKGARLLKEVSPDVRPDTGHIHLHLDDEVFSQATGIGLEFDFAEIYAKVKEGATIPPGQHQLKVELVDSLHRPFIDRIIDARLVTVT